MTPWLRWVALQAALAQATMVAIRVMAGYRALDFEAGPAGLGLIASAFAISALLAAIPVGRAADRFGGAAVSAVGIALNLAGVAAALLAPSFAGLVMACGVSGLGHVAVLVGQQLFVAQHVADRDSDSAFGMLTAASSVGQLIAPPVVGLALTVPLAGIQRSTSGLAVALAFALLSAVGILALLRTDRRRRARGSSEQPPASDRPAVRGRWRAVLVSGIVLAAIDLLYSFLPLWASDNGVSPLQVGILLSIRAAIGVVSRIGLGRLVTRFGRKLLIVVAVSLGGVGFAALPFLGLAGAYAAMVALGVGLALPQPLTVTWLLAGVPKAKRGRLLGMRMTANRAAQSAVPVGIGLTAAPFGSAGALLSIALLLAATTVVTATASIPDPEAAGEGA